MKTRIVLAAATAISAHAALAGPLSKFDGKAPSAEYDTARSIGDVERCLIDADAAPFVYRQPDRPDDVTLVWVVAPGNSLYRADLHRTAAGTHVRAWMAEKVLNKCAG